jgi:hypothetical protein
MSVIESHEVVEHDVPPIAVVCPVKLSAMYLYQS